ncbi:MAG: aquaporin family protein [Nocardioidaceae bacterium]|nr:aquaporin family protein [Nocardioidaceae bacterium]
MEFGDIFLSEVMGTATLLLFGCGVVANAVLVKTNGFNGGFLMINFGWGIGVFAGVYVAFESGAHLNPAVTFGLLAAGVDFSFNQVLAYLLGQFVGAFLGAVLAWAAYRQHFDDPETEVPNKLGVFSTGPGIASPVWNVVTEAIGTFVLVFVILSFGPANAAAADAGSPAALGPLAVALLVVGIGTSLGGPTGYAINPARDLAPRIAHAVLPIKNKGDSNWGYSWVPVVGPLIGGVLAGLVGQLVNFL